MAPVRVNGKRLWSDLMASGSIAQLPHGGVDRMALTDGDRDVRNLFGYWCEAAGLALTVDAMGNMFARREGTDPSLPPVMLGSHLDSQSPGGKFDGPLGVIGALEAVRSIAEAGIATKRALEVVNWTNEEGARFSPGLMGSAVFAGALPLADAHASVDREGKRFGDELRRIRYCGDAPVGGRAVDAYFELHIEQGPLLEEAGIVIGAVTHSHHSVFCDMEVLGENAHIQSMPMMRRRNALVGAAKLIDAIDAVGRAYAPAGSASAMVLDCWPNNRVIVPHRATFSYAILHPDEDGAAAMAREVAQAEARIAAETGLVFNTLVKRLRAPIHFDEGMIQLTEAAAGALGYSCARMRSRAGHDAFSMSRICPTELIFVPSRDGWSHSEREWTAPEHCTAGVEVMANAVLARANR
jgi:beta-ureidopropionase / N-carbamoyl-L-amino-acid hydrolase